MSEPSAALESIRGAHQGFCRAVDAALGQSEVCERWQAQCHAPTAEQVAPLAGAAADVGRALAQWLSAMDAGLGNEGAGTVEPTERVTPEQLRTLVSRLEPAGAATEAGWSGGVLPEAVERQLRQGGWVAPEAGGQAEVSSTLARLLQVHGRVTALSLTLEGAAASSAGLAELREVYKRIVTGAARTTGDGLVARLQRLGEVTDRRHAPREQSAYPWDRRDITELEAAAERADRLTSATDGELARDADRRWCDEIEGYLERLPRLEPEQAMSLGLVIEQCIEERPPEPSARARGLLERLADVEELDADAREQARRAARKPTGR